MRLTKRVLDAEVAGGKDRFIWCGQTPGFSARIYPSGKKVFVAQVRVGKGIRRVKIGLVGPYTVDKARERAEAIIRAAAEGRDPQREKREARDAPTVAELCDEYLAAARAGLVVARFKRPKRASTVAIDEGRVARHIKPLIGKIRATDLRRVEVQRMADAIVQGKTAGIFKAKPRVQTSESGGDLEAGTALIDPTVKPRGRAVVTGGAGTAARVVELLGGIYSWAEKRELVSGTNPAHGIDTARGEAKDRVLSGEELLALGKALDKNQAKFAMPAAAVRLIAMTGLRRDEACALRWSEIDFAGSCLRLECDEDRALDPADRQGAARPPPIPAAALR